MGPGQHVVTRQTSHESVQQDIGAAALKEAETIDVLCPEGAWFGDACRASLGLLDLESNGEVARQQSEADGNTIRMQAVADQMIEVVSILDLLDHLFNPPATVPPKRKSSDCVRRSGFDVESPGT